MPSDNGRVRELVNGEIKKETRNVDLEQEDKKDSHYCRG